MSIYVSLTETDGDIGLRSGRRGLTLATAGDKIVQNIRQRLEMFRGEWFLDLSKGVPYYRDILGQKPRSAPVVRSVIREQIAATPGVVEVISIDSTFDSSSRQLNLVWVARIAEPTTTGQTTVTAVTFFLTDGSGNILSAGTNTLTTI